MFRKMRRFKQQLEESECVEILKNEKRGALCLIGDGGYPYAIPMSHYYDETEKTIYFHGAKEGHKIDAIKSCPKACFCVWDKGYALDGDWALNIKSVVAFGKVSLVDDIERTRDICVKIAKKFSDDPEYLEKELSGGLHRAQCLSFSVEHMTGKLVNEK